MGVDPAGAGGRDDHHGVALPGARAVELLHHQRRAFVVGLGGLKPGIQTDRLLRGFLHQGGELCLVEPAAGEPAALQPEVVEIHHGLRAAGALGDGGPRGAGQVLGVLRTRYPVRGLEEQTRDHALDDAEREDRRQHGAGQTGGVLPQLELAGDHPDEQLIEASQAAGGHEQADEDRERDPGDTHVVGPGRAGGFHEVGDLVLPADRGGGGRDEVDHQDIRGGESGEEQQFVAERVQVGVELDLGCDELPPQGTQGHADAVAHEHRHTGDNPLVVPGPRQERGHE